MKSNKAGPVVGLKQAGRVKEAVVLAILVFAIVIGALIKQYGAEMVLGSVFTFFLAAILMSWWALAYWIGKRFDERNKARSTDIATQS